MGLPLRDRQRHTYGEYFRWPDGVRYELIDGDAYLMSPAPTPQHQRLVGELFRQIADAVQDSPCEVFIAPFDVRLPRPGQSDEETDTVVQPDLVIVCDPTKIDDRGCRGAPDWVIEVLSPATAAHDQTVKLAAFERAGVPECWFVHPVDRTVAVYRLEEGRYGRPMIAELAGNLSPQALPRVLIDWARTTRRRGGP